MTKEDIIKQIKEKIDFKNDDEKRQFDIYLKSRGVFVYKNAVEALLIVTNNEKISYEQFNNYLRYDKTVRDYLYTFLGTFEEIFRNYLFDKVEYIGSIILKGHDIKTEDFRIMDNDSYNDNFYKHCKLDFKGLINVYNNVLVNDKKYEKEKLEKIRELRNDVMHHQLILIDKTKVITKENIENRISIVSSYINTLIQYLNYNSSYGDSLKKRLQELKVKTISPIICEVR